MINVLKPGFNSTIQDLGRFGFQKYGVPYSGALDMYSAKLANTILGNDENAAVLEITMQGPELQFNNETQICFSGANLSPRLNKEPIQLNRIVDVQKGDILSCGKLIYGFRSYIAVSRGFNTDDVMKSRSMYTGITDKFKLLKGDNLSIFTRAKKVSSSHALVKIDDSHFNTKEIDVLKGPEYHLLSANQKNKLTTQTFTISKYNSRMAYQVEELLKNNLKPIITSSVLPGTVQLTPNGTLIILMRDCQTTGGYPRILQLRERAINRLAQKFTGDRFRFSL